MCDCLEKTTKSLREKIKTDVEREHKVNEWIEPGKYQNKGFSLSGGPSTIGMPFTVEYRQQKTNGEPAKNVTKKEVNVYPTFCPFCGVKIDSK